MADKRISQLVDRGTVANNDVVPIVVSGATTTNKATISSIQTFMQGNLDLGVTSVGITLGSSGTDVSVSGSPITSSGNITINLPTASATNRGLLSAADWTTFNNKADAGDYVTLATTQTITAQKTFTTSGSSDTMIISHGSGSGFALDVLKAGNGEAIRVTKSSGSGNAMTISGGNFEAPTIVKTGGTSSQFLKADGSVDSNTYLTTGSAGSTYVPYSGAAASVNLGAYSITANAINSAGSGSTAGQINLRSDAFFSLVNGYGSIASGTTNQFNLYQTTGAGVFRGAILSLNSITASATRTYTLPDASGTLALSSDLGAYLPLTGGTISGQLNVGSGNLRIAAEGASNITILRNFTGTAQGQSGFNHVGFNNSNNFYFTKNLNNGCILSFNNTAYRTYTFPDSDATIASTSNLASYLPLTGGTLTGALNGTSASFTGAVTSGTKFISTAGNNNIVFESLSATTGYQYFQLLNNTAHTIFGIEGTAAGSLLTGGTANASVFTSVGNTNLEFGTNQIKRLTIAASTGAATFSSSVGIGAAPTGTYGTLSVSGGISIKNDNSAKLEIGRYSAGVPNSYIKLGSSSNALIVTNNTDTADILSIQNGGNVGIGTTSPGNFNGVSFSGPFLDVAGLIQVKGTSANTIAGIQFGGDTFRKGLIYSSIGTEDPYLAFATASSGSSSSATDRMRITSGGYLKASNNGTYVNSTQPFHELISNQSNEAVVYIYNTSANPYNIYNRFSGAAPNNNTNYFMYCDDNAASPRVVIYSNGGIANYQANDTNLSDERTKKDIEPIESYWDKFKAIEIVKFKYKDQTHDDYNIGVIAQQVEAVAPEFVDVDGWNTKPELDEEGNEIISEEEPLKAIYTADLHHATIKVLQEAMAKIEKLETEIDSLKNQMQ